MTTNDKPSDPYIGRVLRKEYKVLKRLGAGGMGAVYLAEQEGIGRQAAIKVLHKAAVEEDPTLVERFRREAKAAVALEHPSIVNVYTFGELEDGTFFLAMEFVEGTSLTAKLREAPLDPLWCADLVAQMAEALAEAHDKAIIHRDLKPDNIFITESMGKTIPKILDFGVAKLTDEVDLTKTGLIYGTPKYMSPEQIRGEMLDGRSDQYSLGIILYFMLAGEVPIKSETPIGYIIAHQNEIPPPIRELRPDLELPPALDYFVLKMLHKDRNERFPDMIAVRNALREVVAGTAVVPESPVGKIQSANRAEEGQSNLILILIIGILLIGGVFLLLKYVL